jgi:hypothetical protein
MTKFKNAMTAAAMAAVLTASQAMAADSSLFAPGKPAGVQTAQGSDRFPLVPVLGAAVIITLIAVVVGSQHGSSVGAPCGSSNCSAPTSTRQ